MKAVRQISLAFLLCGSVHALDVYGYTALRHDRFYVGSNKNLFTGAADWSGVGKSTTSRYATMITSKHFISATHYSPAVGDTVKFYSGNLPSSSSTSMTVASITVIMGDLVLGTFTQDCPSWVKKYPILDARVLLTQRTAYEGIVFGADWNQTTDYTLSQRIGKCKLWFSGNADIWGGGVENQDFTGGLIKDVALVEPVVEEADYGGLEIGDSSGPSFAFYNGKHCLIGVNSSFVVITKAGFPLKEILANISSNYQSQIATESLPFWRPQVISTSDALDCSTVTINSPATEEISVATGQNPDGVSPVTTLLPRYKISGSTIYAKQGYVRYRVGTEIVFSDLTAGTDVSLAISGSYYTAALTWTPGHDYAIRQRYNFNGTTGAWTNITPPISSVNGSEFTFKLYTSEFGKFFRPVIFKDNYYAFGELIGTDNISVDGSPAGGYKDSIISMPFLADPVFKGKVLSTSGDTVTLDDSSRCSASLAVGQFYSGSPPYITHLIENVDSGAIGVISLTSSGSTNCAGTIQANGISSAAFSPGSTVIVRPMITFSDIFGAENEVGLYNGPYFQGGDEVWKLFPTTQSVKTFYPYNDPPFVGLFGVDEENASGTQVLHMEALVVRHKTAQPISWQVAGYCKQSATRVTLVRGDNWVASPESSIIGSATIGNSNLPVDLPSPYNGLPYGVRSGASFATADTLSLSALPGSITPGDGIFYRKSPGYPDGWFRENSTTAASSASFGSGRGVLLRLNKSASAPTAIWEIPKW
ncbi:MAG: hypothetical protein V4726_12845 [Verrucomicrobiota bacterium]